MKKIFIMAAMAVSGLAITSCSSNEDGTQETTKPTQGTAKPAAAVSPIQNEAIIFRETDSIPETNTTTPPPPTPPGGGVDDGTIPPKKP